MKNKDKRTRMREKMHEEKGSLSQKYKGSDKKTKTAMLDKWGERTDYHRRYLRSIFSGK